MKVALQASAMIMRLVRSVPGSYKSIADQIIRSSSSFALNLSEGSGRFGRDRLHFWRIAYGSGKETETACYGAGSEWQTGNRSASTARQNACNDMAAYESAVKSATVSVSVYVNLPLGTMFRDCHTCVESESDSVIWYLCPLSESVICIL